MHEQEDIMIQLRKIFDDLFHAGLDMERTIVLIKENDGMVAYDHELKPCDTQRFKDIFYGDYAYGIFSAGNYSKQIHGEYKRVRASLDDTAQMFGPYIDVNDEVKKNRSAQYLKDGFLVLGRFETETVASAILMEKTAKVEVSGSKIGNLHYIHPLMGRIEHLVYLKKYSSNEKKRASK